MDILERKLQLMERTGYSPSRYYKEDIHNEENKLEDRTESAEWVVQQESYKLDEEIMRSIEMVYDNLFSSLDDAEKALDNAHRLAKDYDPERLRDIRAGASMILHRFREGLTFRGGLDNVLSDYSRARSIVDRYGLPEKETESFRNRIFTRLYTKGFSFLDKGDVDNACSVCDDLREYEGRLSGNSRFSDSLAGYTITHIASEGMRDLEEGRLRQAEDSYLKAMKISTQFRVNVSGLYRLGLNVLNKHISHCYENHNKGYKSEALNSYANAVILSRQLPYNTKGAILRLEGELDIWENNIQRKT
ncbi:MAG: hypothetical protein ACQEP1_01985 [Nanobdellota archaeon]